MTLAATILLSALPQVFPGGDLKLPPKKPTAEQQQPEVRPLSEIERFQRDLKDMNASQVKVDRKLDEMGRAYPKIEELILQVARTARAADMRNLMPVARRFGRISGSPRVADELLFQLLARPLGGATRSVVETMAVLKGPDAKAALKQCVRGRIPAVRRHAVEALGPLCTEEDATFALQLSREQSLDLRLRGVDLLVAIGGESATARLVELLSKDPALAAAACEALVRLGGQAVPALQKRAGEPAVDRSYVYAAFALARIGEATGEDLVPAELLAPLQRRLNAPEALTRVLAAVPLADLVYRAGPGDDASLQAADRKLVDTLLLVVEPREFVPNLDMLRGPAEARLLRHTGRVIDAEQPLSWRDWWQDRGETFLGVRARVAVDEGNVGAAVLALRQQGRTTRVLGEDLADAEPREGAVEVLLTSEQMLALVKRLEQDGLGDPLAMRVDSALPRVRSLEVRVPGGRSSVAVTERPHLAFDALAAAIQDTVDDELWQLYRIPDDEPNRAAFWRSERRWRDENPDELARGRRFVARVLRGWQGWDDQRRARAVGFVVSNPQRKELLREEEGDAIVAALRKRSELGALDLQLLEIAASVPGDRVWRDCVEVAVSAEGGGRDAVRGVFKVLGPDAVLSALGDERAVVRRAAVEEAVAVRDQRAAPTLVRLLSDEDFDVQRSATFACGHLRVQAASRPLVEQIAAPETDPVIRRESLRALGRVGGELAFPVLQRAMTSPNREDKEAALRGLGELRDPRAAHLLAEYVVLGHGRDLGELAKFHLQRQGASHAMPALERQIPACGDEDIRGDLVLLLGMYHDPKNVPALMDLLRRPKFAGEAAPLIEGATGVDLTNVPDRITTIEAWWRDHKSQQQHQWLLEALALEEVRHTLEPRQFATDDLTVVPELARLMVEVEQPRLWVLCATLLRDVSGQDYGVVNQQTPPDVREGLAGRYRVLAESSRAAQKK